MGVFLKNSVYVSQCPLEPNYTNPKVRRITFWTLYKGTIKIPILVPKRGGGEIKLGSILRDVIYE